MSIFPGEEPSTSSEDVWGLISDVHGNYAALEQALAVLSACGATRLAALGDYLGRGDSDRCVERIRALADVAIVGNRDLDWQDRVAPSSRAWVLSLPKTAQAGQLLVSHGDARLTPALSTGQIGREFVRAWRELHQRNALVWAFGHSHHARTWRKPDVSEVAELLTDAVHPLSSAEPSSNASAVALEPGWRYFVNVGTTGLPFPGKGGPSVAIVDLRKAEIRQIPLVRV